MAERSFKKEVEKLRLGAGETFQAEGILAVTKALLQCGVGYVGGYQGAPISHLMDVLADAREILSELGVRFEANASESAAVAMLAASVHYPIRGAVAFKGPVGVNVASDALANLSSSGVTGGALIIVGEDYGEGSSIMQERSHAFATKSQTWLFDPRPDLNSFVKSVEDGFALSEASNTPVMMIMRIRACHVTGRMIAKDNQSPKLTVHDALKHPRRKTDRIVLPPNSYVHEQEKVNQRLPRAIDYIETNELNEFFGPATDSIGIILQGGMYNSVIRGLQRLGLADLYGNTDVALYVLNVVYPLSEFEISEFCRGKHSVLVVEEGQPAYLEESIAAILFRSGRSVKLFGKGYLPIAGEYTGTVVMQGLLKFLNNHASSRLANDALELLVDDDHGISDTVPVRPPGFCTGCPERPIFAAMKLVEEELGEHQITGDIGCHLFSTMPPFEIGGTTMGYGLGPASNAAFDGGGDKRPISIIGDGGFWHNGLTSSIGNAVFNQSDGVTIVVDNYYAAATGGQDVMSSRAHNEALSTQHAIGKAADGVGVKWIRQIDDTYDVKKLQLTLHEALTTEQSGPKIIVASSECMLNKQRREAPLRAQDIATGKRVSKPRFGVDETICNGDHACMRLSGCPSLTLKQSSDPLKDDPVAYIDQSCVGCGNCGEVADAATLCPSFYRLDTVHNPSTLERFVNKLRSRWIAFLIRRRQSNRLSFEIR
jgi:indolepyruvate ferredoxin oxidoreductase, alpha subunit